MSATELELYGTDAPVAPPQVLHAGRLTAELEAGNLRYVRYAGVEVMRGIAFLVRGASWSTLAADISALRIRQQGAAFAVAYRAAVHDGGQRLSYAARIDGRDDGTLRFHVVALPETEFRTCRTGFVVLHAAQVAGGEALVEHVDGSRETVRFPELIDPWQPMRDLRAVAHAAAPGLLVSCRMDGDTFEMEDQRNWTDASFKTYCRPLARPWPYLLPAGTEFEQAVSLAVEQSVATPATGNGAGSDLAEIQLGPEAGTPMPPLGLGCTPEEAAAALPHAATLRNLGIATLVCRYDPGRGHGAAALRDYAALATALGADVDLQLVAHALHDFPRELRDMASQLASAGLRPACVFVSPAADLRSTPPGQAWPPAPPLALLYRAAREAFPGVRIGGGTLCGFAELNRKPPPTEAIDVMTFATSAIVHAADDRSVMETLQALPAVAGSARALARDRPFVVGPSAIGLRDNPVGSMPLANPRALRQPMSGFDPRHRGRFNAAWTLGYVAAFAPTAARIALSAPVGDFGVLHDGAALPVFEVLRACAALRGQALRDCRVCGGGGVVVLAVRGKGGSGTTLLVGNTLSRPARLRIAGAPTPQAREDTHIDLSAFGTASVFLR